LADHAALAELSNLAGAASYMLTEFADARAYYAEGIHAARMLEEPAGPADPIFEIDLLVALSGLDFELGDFARAALTLTEAQWLLDRWAPGACAEEAGIAWISAQIARTTGQPAEGLPLAMKAAHILSQLGSANASGRIQTIVADIALDLAETFPLAGYPRLRDAFVSQAQPYATRAIQLAETSGDITGKGLAQLALQRCQRLRGRA